MREISSDLVRSSDSDGAYEDDVKAGFTFNSTFQCTLTDSEVCVCLKFQNILEGQQCQLFYCNESVGEKL